MSPNFFQRHPVGNLLSRITNDVSYVQNLLSDELFEVIASAVKVLAVVGILLSISPKLTLISAGVLPVVALVFMLLRRRIYQQNLRLQESQENLSGCIQQNFAGIKLIQAETIEAKMHEQTLMASRALENVAVKRETISLVGNLATTVLSYLPMIALLWGYGGFLVIGKQLTLGSLLAFTQYVFGLIAPATRLFKFNMNLQAGYAALDRIYEVLDTKPEICDEGGAQPLHDPIEEIEFDNVCLAYPAASADPASSQVPALRNLSFTLRRGDKLALVGPSGSGKSSVLLLLLRFWEPTSGEIRLNGRPLRSYTLQSLRQAIAYVAQDAFVFAATVRDNVALAQLASDEEILKALELSASCDFLKERAEGLDYPIAHSGGNVSGGQRQRLALARAVVKDAGLYVFDEATSALDSNTEREVLTRLQEFLQDKTALVIAHRFSSLQLANRILVLSEGALVEEGTKPELLARKGLFAALYGAQKG
jgi:ABC-type multidrug transport system fused ATPase/permease subunit